MTLFSIIIMGNDRESWKQRLENSVFFVAFEDRLQVSTITILLFYLPAIAVHESV